MDSGFERFFLPGGEGDLGGADVPVDLLQGAEAIDFEFQSGTHFGQMGLYKGSGLRFGQLLRRVQHVGDELLGHVGVVQQSRCIAFADAG